MRHPGSGIPHTADPGAWLRRWDRIGVGVRCAYNPACDGAPLLYLEAGRRVVAAGARSEDQVQRRVLTVLLQTARDEALPWHWRHQCLDCTTWPLARLQSLLRYTDPDALQAMHRAVQAAHDALDLPPRSINPARCSAPTPPSADRTC